MDGKVGAAVRSAKLMTVPSGGASGTVSPASMPTSAIGTGKLICFDVFETLIIRSVSPHHEIFDRLGRSAQAQQLIPCSAFAFARTREAAERRARACSGDAASLRDIYEELERALSLTAAAASRIMELELLEEERALRAVESARPLMAQARQGGGGVAFVSDMYLPSAFIRAQLEKHGFWRSGDRLYVSHEHGCEKRDGRLFKVVAASEGVQTSQIVHYGNNAVADLRGPQRVGAVGKLVTCGNPNRYECALEVHRGDTDGRAALLAGASRLARTSVTAELPHDQALIDVAAGVVAPVLTSFVLWLFRQAEERGLKRLYFLSRDAEILLRIARQIAPVIGSTVELRYLYASRLAWNCAVSSPAKNPHLWYSVVYQSAIGFTNAELLGRVGLNAQDMERITAASPKAWNDTKDRGILREALQQLEAEGVLGELAERNKELVLAYLQQEGLFDDTPHAVVDVGWRGTQHDVLIELQHEQQVTPAYGLFFGLDLSDSPWGGLRSGFYFDARRVAPEDRPQDEMAPERYQPPRVPVALQKAAAPRDLYSLFELFCAGREGSLLAYRREAGRILPVLDERRPGEVQGWNIEKVYETVAAFVAHLDVEERCFLDVDVRPALSRVIDLLWTSPTRLEAEAWGCFPWELGLGTSRCTSDFAPPYDHRFISRKFGGHPTLSTQWPAGSLARSNPVMVAFKTLRDGTAYRRLHRKSKAVVKGLAR